MAPSGAIADVKESQPIYEAPKDPPAIAESETSQVTARFNINWDQFVLNDPSTLQTNSKVAQPLKINFAPPQFTNFYFAWGLPKPWMDEMAFNMRFGDRSAAPPLTLHSPFYRNYHFEAGLERHWGKGIISGFALRYEDINHPDDPANDIKNAKEGKGVTGWRFSALFPYALSESTRMYLGVGVIGLRDDTIQIADPSLDPLQKYAGSFSFGRVNTLTSFPPTIPIGDWQLYGFIEIAREANFYVGGGREGDHLATPEEQQRYCPGQACGRTDPLKRSSLTFRFRFGGSRPDPNILSLFAYNQKPSTIGLVNGALSHVSLLVSNAVANGDNIDNLQTMALFDDPTQPDNSTKFKGSSLLSAADAIASGMSYGELNVNNAILLRQNWRYGLANLLIQKGVGVLFNAGLTALDPMNRPPNPGAEQIGVGAFLGLCDEASSLVLSGLSAIPDVRKDNKFNNKLTKTVGGLMIAGGASSFLYSAIFAGLPNQEGLFTGSLVNPVLAKTPDDFINRGVLNQCFARGGSQAVWTGYKLLDAKSNFDQMRSESQRAQLLAAASSHSRAAQLLEGSSASVTPLSGGAMGGIEIKKGPDDILSTLAGMNPYRWTHKPQTPTAKEAADGIYADKISDIWENFWVKTERAKELKKQAISKSSADEAVAVWQISRSEFSNIINEWAGENATKDIKEMTQTEFQVIYDKKYPKK